MRASANTESDALLDDYFEWADEALATAMGGDIVEFNDSHTHAEVLKAFDDAIAMFDHQSDGEASEGK